MSVFVGPSIWRDLNVVTATRLMLAMTNAPDGEKVIWAPLWNDALIGRSRSLMCTEFLKSDADVMIIIDDDIVFEDGDFWKIVEGCRATRGIYGAGYVTRSTKPHLTSRVFPNTEVLWAQGPVRRPVEIQYLATGFFALHRDVLEAMIDHRFDDADGGHVVAECQLGADRPFFPFFSPFQVMEPYGDESRRHYLSEDWAFCNRARQLDFKVWMDQSIVLQHLGVYPYTVADLNNPGNAFPSTGIDRIDTTSTPPQYGHPLLDSLLPDLTEWSGDDPGDVRRMVAAGAETTSQLFRTKPADQSEAEWYRRDDVGYAYAAELVWWHQLGGGAWAASVGDVDIEGKRVLNFGAGISTWDLIAASRGAIVNAWEPNPIMREFADWRADKHGIDRFRSLRDEPSELLGEPYDAIVAWHVFEHLEDPEGDLKRMLGWLAPGGLLITQSGFDDHLPEQHHAHPDWDGALAAAGLERVEAWVWRLPDFGRSAAEALEDGVPAAVPA